MSKYLSSIHEDYQRSLGRSLQRRGETNRLLLEVEPEYRPGVPEPRPDGLLRSHRLLVDCVMAALLVVAILVTMYLFSTF